MYQVLYRKWRSQTFSDVYGQPHITAALKNELRTGRLAHAYLFTGSRGTGKTSCAKILAKAVNCLNPHDGDPCNECDNCHGIDDGTILDVVEIDAASNNGVDSIRELREEVNYTPAVVKYRVYIIDEVHMLSTGAFNALLKTLEEPPAHVIFVLATTEVHKLPATILSRCQRFDFSRIAPEDIVARINYIAEHENFTVTQEAALLIARLADGGMRDALSLLDQCISRSHEVTVEIVTDATGMTSRDYLYQLSEAVRTANGGAAMMLIDQLHADSRDMERLCTELIDFYRNLMIIKSVPNPENLIIVSSVELERLRSEADIYELPVILHCMEALQEALEKLRLGASRRVEMEMAMLRLCAPELDTGTASLLRRIKVLELALKTGRLPSISEAHIASVPSKNAEPHGREVYTDKDVPPIVTNEASVSMKNPTDMTTSVRSSSRSISVAKNEAPKNEVPFSRWKDVVEGLSVSCPPLCGVLKGSTAVLRGDYVLIETDNELFKSLVTRDGNKAVLVDAIRGVIGRIYRIGIKKRKVSVNKTQSDDPLSSFIKNSLDLGVDLDVK